MVKFNRRGRLDTSRVRDMRGKRGGKVAIGGGMGILILLASLFFGVDLSFLGEILGGGTTTQQQQQQQAPPEGGGLADCDEVTDIDEQRDCRFVAFENSIQGFWAAEFERRDATYQPASYTVFTGGVQTRCGAASSAMGPFYCPADQGVYMDIGFFDVLEQQLGAQGGDFAEAYIFAHEVGHHVETLAGYTDRVQTRQGPDSDAVRLELMADCLGGVWAAHATTTSARGSDEPLLTEITDDDIAAAIDAARTVGDDYIQERQTGQVNPESFGHGTSEQRMRWFRIGLDTGDMDNCDTWATDDL